MTENEPGPVTRIISIIIMIGGFIFIVLSYTSCVNEWEEDQARQEKEEDEHYRIRADYDRKQQRNKEARIKQFNIRKANCYENGTSINETFDLKSEYNLNCRKVKYLNDHILNEVEKQKTGYIKGSSSFSGFMSHGSGNIGGQFSSFVYSQMVATGALMKHVEYCELNNEKFDLIQEYYLPQDFIMWYVDKCIS